MCCKRCGAIPLERMFIGLLYHRGIIPKDIKTLLLVELDSTPYYCYCHKKTLKTLKKEKETKTFIPKIEQTNMLPKHFD